jgi:hypothetical protein
MIAERQTFVGKRVFLDGCSFYGCQFDSCTLVISGTIPFVLEGNQFNSCNWELLGPAANVRDALRSLYTGGLPSLVEEVFADIRGTSPTTFPGSAPPLWTS